MIQANDARPLSDFNRDADAHLDRLARTGQVEVLTVGGEARGVVMSLDAYDELARKAAVVDNLGAIQRSVDDIAAGRTQDAREAMREIAVEPGIRFIR